MKTGNRQWGKTNSWIANSIIPSIGNQLVKFNYPKDSWDYLSWLYTQSNQIVSAGMGNQKH